MESERTAVVWRRGETLVRINVVILLFCCLCLIICAHIYWQDSKVGNRLALLWVLQLKSGICVFASQISLELF